MSGVHGSPVIRTYVSNSGALLTTGKVKDLSTEQIGFFRVDKRGVGIPDTAQAKPTARTSPFFKLGIGRAPYAAQFAKQPIEGDFPFLTREIRGKDIIRWEGTKANPSSQTEMWALGYDGIDANKRLFSAIDYHELIIGIRLWGGPIKRLNPNAPWVQRYYHVDKGCINKCLDVCETNPGLADEYIVDDILKKFNADHFNGYSGEPISKYVKASKLRKSAEVETPVTVLTATQYTFSICDDGSNSALGAVQAQYQGFEVEKQGRVGATSTYTMWRPNSSGAPAAFVNTAPIALAVCNECPSGYTLVDQQYVYTVERPVAPTTDLTTPAAQQTYANTIGSAYAADSRGLATVAGNAGSGYTNGTYDLDATGGGGTGGKVRVVVAAGAISSRTILDKGRGYTSAPTFSLTSLGAGTGGTVTATISAAPTVTSNFVSSNGSSAFVTVSSPTALSNGAVAADTLVGSDTASAYCNPPAGASVAWVAGLTRTIAPKQWMLHLEDTVCGQSRLAELQAAYPSLVVSEQGTAGDCGRVYVTTNYSEPFVEEECTPSQYQYKKPDAFFAGAEWNEFVTPLETPVCTPEEEAAQPCVAAGIKFETAAFVNYSDECLYGYFQYDIDEVDPVYMEITATQHTNDWTASPCDKTSMVVTKLRETKFATGRGRVIQEAEHETLLQYGKYHTTNPSRNRAYGFYLNAKEQVWYDTYRLTVEGNESQHGIMGKEGTKQRTQYVFAFPSGQGKQFESLINGYIISLDEPELTPVIL